MDVTLVLTHRCNLACRYCYAGEHVRKDMSDTIAERALDLLYCDGAPVAELAFFGGEPWLAPDLLRRAVAGAEERAARGARGLLVQCTSNATRIGAEEAAFAAQHGMHVTVSIDGVREAHDLNRPQAGGGSSFDAVVSGLRALRAAGARFDALLVVTPLTAPYLARSVAWLWDEQVVRVRMNLELRSRWSDGDRAALEAALAEIADELVRRRLRGENVSFDAFDPALRRAGVLAPRSSAPRRQIVVGTTGHIYPCAPMVGEDRDGGPEAAMRIAHLSDGAAVIVDRVERHGAGCGLGERSCACAAYLETGDRACPGPIAAWLHQVAWAQAVRAAAALSSGVAPPPRLVREVERPVSRRGAVKRLVVLGAGLAAASGAAAAAYLPSLTPRIVAPPPQHTPPPEHVVAGGVPASQPPPPRPPAEITIDGQIAAPPQPSWPDVVAGGAVPVIEPVVRGDIGAVEDID